MSYVTQTTDVTLESSMQPICISRLKRPFFQFQLRRRRRNDEKSPLRGERRRRRRRRRFAAVSEEAFKFSTTTSTKFFKGRGFTISNNMFMREVVKEDARFSSGLGVH